MKTFYLLLKNAPRCAFFSFAPLLRTCLIIACLGCGSLLFGGTQPCDQESGTPGCNDATCQATICAVDPFCCNVAWDGICASEAIVFCSLAPACSITNLTVTNLRCGDGFNSDDAYADVSFNVVGGSGNYSVRAREAGSGTSTNGNTIIGATMNGTINSTLQLTVGNVDGGDMAEVFIVDSNNGSCVSNIVTVTVPLCPPCPAVGGLVITEIMQNPAAVDDNVGEWFEVYNAGPDQINMKNMVISDDDTDSHTILIDLLINSGQYLVLARNGNSALNGGFTADYVYGEDIALANGADEVVLTCQGTEIDRVNYDGGPNFPDPTGASMQLDPMSLNATDNNDGSNWCEATTAYGDGDLGTPGSANTSCCAVAIDAVDVTDVSCADGSDGVIVVTVSGATTYNFSINGPGGIQTNTTGTFTGLMAGSYTIIVADGANANCTATSTAAVGTMPDTEDPMIDCVGEIFVNNDPGLCNATIDLPAPKPSDNCGIDRFEFRYVEVDGDNNELGPFTMFADVTAGAMVTLPVGRYRFRFRVYDEAGNLAGCNQFVTVTDNEAPVITTCTGSTVNFNGEESFNSEDVIDFDATDNCGVASITYDPPLISCEDLGTTVSVTVTVTDVNGNPNSCVADVVVDGLPCGFMLSEIGCNGDADYDVPTETFTLEATNCYYANPYNQDEITFVKTELCGNGEIIAEVTNIDPFGFAGIMMRETLLQGSKKIALSRDNGSLARREARTATNGPAYPQQFPAFGKNWLRLVRNGNQFIGYISTNGISWQQVMVANISMSQCIYVGLFLTNKQPNQTITADFRNVTVTPAGGGALQQLQGAPLAAFNGDVSVYPNPTAGAVIVDLGSLPDKKVTLEVRNTNGQMMRQYDLDQTADRRHELQLGDLPTGIYWLRIQAAGEAPITKRIVVQRP